MNLSRVSAVLQKALINNAQNGENENSDADFLFLIVSSGKTFENTVNKWITGWYPYAFPHNLLFG